MRKNKKYQWAVVGAGPAGITSVGLLLDAGISSDQIIWIDPEFKVGDFGQLWYDVDSNTKVALFLSYLNGVESFAYSQHDQSFILDTLDPNGFAALSAVAEPLQWVTDHLTKKVDIQKSIVEYLQVKQGCWELTTLNDIISADKVILAMGSEPKSLDYANVTKIDLAVALQPEKLSQQCSKQDTVAVFGSSHSAMIVIRSLVESGVKEIMNFYLSPLRYALPMGDWILYDDTGLKGETAKWVHENVSNNTLPQLKRFVANEDNIATYLTRCDKAVYAVGFHQRQLAVPGVSLANYDQSNGIIAPGLFGAGVAFPLAVTDPFGRVERNVGLWKFLKNLRRTLPVWQAYGI